MPSMIGWQNDRSGAGCGRIPASIIPVADCNRNKRGTGMLKADWEVHMTKTFDPAPFDKHAENPKEATKFDLIIDEQLRDGIVGGSFPASDPISATQPSPSRYDGEGLI